MNLSPIRQIEEAISLLRCQEIRAWLFYLTGTVPLLLTLLTFVHDMSAGYWANRCALESLGCALAFLWANAWKSKFGATLLASMNGPGSTAPQWSFWHALYLQCILQAFKLVALPFAIASVLPIAWTSSFFRSATIEASLPESTLRTVIAKSARRAGANTRANWLGLFIIWVISLLTFVNVYIFVGLLPSLFRLLSGVETTFTRSMNNIFSFNVFCVVVALTWLIIDPLVLCYNVVRCFYMEARTDGRDLLAQLRPASVLAALLLTIPLSLSAVSVESNSISIEKLSGAVRHAAQSDDYAWLRTQQMAGNNEDSFSSRINRDISDFFRSIGNKLSDFRKWLRRLFEENKPASEKQSVHPVQGGDIRWLLYSLAALVVAAALVVLWRSRVVSTETAIAPSTAAQTPDLNKESLLASDLPDEEWLRLARELLANGELRLAIRAMYLSNLSYLGSHQFIQIARAKSNSIYERELRLRPRGAGVIPLFVQCNRSFERIWYGFDDVTPNFVDLFQQNVEAIRQHAQA